MTISQLTICCTSGLSIRLAMPSVGASTYIRSHAVLGREERDSSLQEEPANTNQA